LYVKEYWSNSHNSRRAEESYVNWIRRFILFNNNSHPEKPGKDKIRSFLDYLAVERNVSALTKRVCCTT